MSSTLQRAYGRPMQKVVSVRRELRNPPRREHGAKEGIRVVMTLACGHELARDFMWRIRRDWGNGGLTRTRAEAWEKTPEVPCIACGPVSRTPDPAAG